MGGCGVGADGVNNNGVIHNNFVIHHHFVILER